MNTKVYYLSALSVMLILVTSCASIVSKSVYPVRINSNPANAAIEIKNRKGNTVYRGHTPVTVSLNAGGGFFRKAIYMVEFSKEGYASQQLPLEATLDGWYFGNLVFGGIIGFLIVDPATGAMFKLATPFLDTSLQETGAQLEEQPLRIYDINTIPDHWKTALARIN